MKICKRGVSIAVHVHLSGCATTREAHRRTTHLVALDRLNPPQAASRQNTELQWFGRLHCNSVFFHCFCVLVVIAV